MTSSDKTITPGQCRAARGFLDWSRDQLAKAANVGVATIADFERGKRQPYERTLRDIRAAFEAEGIEFLQDPSPGLQISRLKIRE
ncbi:Helix-turn-helix [Limimonas halophila]|uniref:Helix-turn-helix n=2 Tax=Limimonas halophila TaxID=1082479 RepID=A0A1G7U869_9PROT|nr:Helix-turn-helix [Limimonas halophila]